VRDDRIVEGVVYDEDGYAEPITDRLTEEEAADDTIAPVWVVEIWQVVQQRGQDVGKWIVAADFKKHGVTLPVNLEKTIAIARRRQAMRADYTYRVRNIQTGAVILAAVL
jgi:hypothetical protein